MKKLTKKLKSYSTLSLLCISTLACTGAIVPLDPNAQYIQGKWRQVSGPGSERLALNIQPDASELYLDCTQPDNSILRSTDAFQVTMSVKGHTFKLNEGVRVQTEVPPNLCEATLPAGNYEAFQVYGGKMHLFNVDNWRFIGVFEFGPKDESDRISAIKVRSKIEKLQ